jgi:hypothetical protein
MTLSVRARAFKQVNELAALEKVYGSEHENV